jgi:hypothetical protein
LNILCTRLERVEGLIYEDYIPETDATKLWKPAPGSVVSYGKAADAARCCCQLHGDARQACALEWLLQMQAESLQGLHQPIGCTAIWL